MKLKATSIIAAFVILVTMVVTCGPADRPATLVPTQPMPTDAPPTLVPVEPTATSAPPTATPTPTSSEWPSARKYGAMVYDPQSQRIFMFGGVEKAHDYADIPEVWVYDPANNR